MDWICNSCISDIIELAANEYRVDSITILCRMYRGRHFRNSNIILVIPRFCKKQKTDGWRMLVFALLMGLYAWTYLPLE